jgi:uncharacterized coiled-coil protein SlyX
MEASFGSRLDSIESQVRQLIERFDRVEDEMHDLNHKFQLFLKDLLRLLDVQRHMEERLQKLESESAPAA